MSELIEKQKVLDALREIATEKFSLDDPYGVYINVLMDVEEKICRLPVVQPNGPDNLVKDSQGLAKELVNDTISRQEAIDAINGVLVEDDACKVWFRLALQNLPSAQPEQRWIPCSERLPEVGQDILMSIGGMYTAEGCLREDGDWAQFRWDAIQRKDMVDAWMPLPEPAKLVGD